MRSAERWDMNPTGTGVTGTGRRSLARRRIAGAAITAVVATSLASGAAAPAYASLTGPVGVTDPVSSFPLTYSDGTDVLQQCLEGPQCVADLARPNPAAPVSFPDNYPVEQFWFLAAAGNDAQPALYEAALEGAFLNVDGSVVDRDQQTFSRLRFRLDNLTPGSTYTITHPYGVDTFDADVDGVIDETADLGCETLPCDFAAAGTSFLGDFAAGTTRFLKQTNALPGMLGNLDSPGPVTGAPNNINTVTVDGLNAGGAGVNTFTVSEFVVQGKLANVPAVRPTVPSRPTASAGNTRALVRWLAPANGGSPITKYTVQTFNAVNKLVASTVVLAAPRTSANSLLVSGLTNQKYTFKVLATNGVRGSALSAASVAVAPRTKPSAARIGIASPGTIGGTLTARANWTAPSSLGGAAITGYVVHAFGMNPNGTVRSRISTNQPSTARTLNMALPKGNYQFVVQARNVVGLGGYSAKSNLVAAR